MTSFPITITKSQTACGNWTLLPDGPLKVGSKMEVDLDSRRLQKFKGADGEFEAEVIALVMEGEPKILIPVSMTDLDEI